MHARKRRICYRHHGDQFRISKVEKMIKSCPAQTMLSMNNCETNKNLYVLAEMEKDIVMVYGFNVGQFPTRVNLYIHSGGPSYCRCQHSK